jgi:hypothetical protein
MKTKYYYREKVNKLNSFDKPIYVSVNPLSGLKSLEEFKFLIKKCIREISKKYNKTSSSQYLKYVSVIEINKSITSDKKLSEGEFFTSRIEKKKKKLLTRPLTPKEIRINQVKEMGFHTHIFLNKSVEFWEIDSGVLKKCIVDTFSQSGIQIDYFFSDTFNDLEGFIDYHSKQLDQLDKSFILTNLN